MRTSWGYEVESLGPIISESEFHDRTGNVYITNQRAEAALNAASQAIRNFCGWHVCPSLSCTAYPVGGGNVAKLPAGYVSAITSITEDGNALPSDAYEWRRDGLVRKAHAGKWSAKWDGITAVYMAGYEPNAVPDLAEAVCAIAAGVLAVSAGVTSESADGVSISYAQSASSIAAGLTYQQKEALAAYKVVNAHGA